MPKANWPWRRRRCPHPRARPPWPMSLKERLYEVRKRRRKTEIPSEYWRWHLSASVYCEHCPYWEARWDGSEYVSGCTAENSRGCLDERGLDAFFRRNEARARYRRLSRKERLYERKKRLFRRRKFLFYGDYDDKSFLWRWYRWRSDITQMPRRAPIYPKRRD